MKAIFGLGNPGDKYEHTRHNVGFKYVDYLADQFNIGSWQEKNRLKSQVAQFVKGGEKILLVKPMTFMNLSGEAVLAIKQYFDLGDADLLVVYDDIDLPFGKLRYREEGSAGTHNGMRSILGVLKTKQLSRLRIGIESRTEEQQEKWPLNEYVLADLSKRELEQLSDLFAEADDLLAEFL